jgi:hypothetical protein
MMNYTTSKNDAKNRVKKNKKTKILLLLIGSKLISQFES